MRILFISSLLLFPETRFGGSKRLFLLADELSRHHSLRVVCCDPCGEGSAFQDADNPLGGILKIDYHRTVFDKLSSPFNITAHLRDQQANVEAYIGSEHYDLLICAYPIALSFMVIPLVRRAEKTLYIEDDLSLELLRRAAREGDFVSRTFNTIRCHQARRYYRAFLPDTAGIVAISSEEAAIIRKDFPGHPVHIAGYGIDCASFPVLDIPGTKTAGFIGNYAHTPNAAAVHWFLEAVWPEVQALCPYATMVFAGPNMPASALRRIECCSAVTYLGTVDSLEDFYRRIDVFVNPIVSQRGLRTKLVEVAAYGRPIVSTALGGEGLDALALHVADDPHSFARIAVSLLNRPEGIISEAVNNRAAVESEYSIQSIATRLVSFAKEVVIANASA